MNSRTRVRNAIERRPVDRVPRYDSFWEDTIEAWVAQGYPRGVDPGEFFGFDMTMMGVDVSLRLEQKLLREDGEYRTVRDRHGETIRKAIGKSRSLECSDHATTGREAWETLKGRMRLNPADKARLDTRSYFLHMEDYPTWEQARAQYDRLRATEKYVVFHSYGPWEGTWRHRGYSELMMDVAADPEWVHDMGRTLVTLLIATLEHGLKVGIRPDALWLVDDLACTRGLLLSPRSWRAIFKPLYADLGRFLKANDISFWLHCCGNCEELIPDFIDCGLNVLQPLQAQSGMDVRQLKPRYGDKLTFWGNIDVTKMSGPAEVLEAEVREKLLVAKAGGGYLYHSDHSIPPEVSFQRYQWMMNELVLKYGQY